MNFNLTKNLEKLLCLWEKSLTSYGTPGNFGDNTTICLIENKENPSDLPITLMVNSGYAKRRELMKKQYESLLLRGENSQKRWRNDGSACFLCDNVGQAQDIGDNLVLPFDTYKEFLVVPNRYPLIRGHFLLVAKQHDDGKKKFSNETSLEYLKTIVDICNKYDLHAIRNHPYAGMSIKEHEHCHLLPKELISNSGEMALIYVPPKSKIIQHEGHVYRLEGTRFDTITFRKRDVENFWKLLCRLDNYGVIFSFVYGSHPDVKENLFFITPHKKIDLNDAVAGESAFYVKTNSEMGSFCYNEYIKMLEEYIYSKGTFQWDKYLIDSKSI